MEFEHGEDMVTVSFQLEQVYVSVLDGLVKQVEETEEGVAVEPVGHRKMQKLQPQAEPPAPPQAAGDWSCSSESSRGRSHSQQSLQR